MNQSKLPLEFEKYETIFLKLNLHAKKAATAIPEENQISQKKWYNLSILSASGFGIDLILEYIANASIPSHGWTNDAYLICFQFALVIGMATDRAAKNVGRITCVTFEADS